MVPGRTRPTSRLLRYGGVRPAVEATGIRTGRGVLGRVQRRPATEIPADWPGAGRFDVAVEGAGVGPARADPDDLVRVAVRALQADRTLRVPVPDPARGRPARVVGDGAVPVLPGCRRLGDADRVVPGAIGDPRDPADQRLRVHRGAVAQEMDSPFRPAATRSAGTTAIRVDPPRLLQRAAGHGDRHARFAG